MHVRLPENEKIKKKQAPNNGRVKRKERKKEQDIDMFANENFNERREM